MDTGGENMVAGLSQGISNYAYMITKTIMNAGGVVVTRRKMCVNRKTGGRLENYVYNMWNPGSILHHNEGEESQPSKRIRECGSASPRLYFKI